MSERLISYYEHPALSNAGGKSMAAPHHELVSRTPKGAVLSGPTGALLQMSDIKLIPNATKEKSNDR
jgi:hypothetical protein